MILFYVQEIRVDRQCLQKAVDEEVTGQSAGAHLQVLLRQSGFLFRTRPSLRATRVVTNTAGEPPSARRLQRSTEATAAWSARCVHIVLGFQRYSTRVGFHSEFTPACAPRSVARGLVVVAVVTPPPSGRNRRAWPAADVSCLWCCNVLPCSRTPRLEAPVY
jgi:hypothetical protein